MSVTYSCKYSFPRISIALSSLMVASLANRSLTSISFAVTLPARISLPVMVWAAICAAVMDFATMTVPLM